MKRIVSIILLTFMVNSLISVFFASVEIIFLFIALLFSIIIGLLIHVIELLNYIKKMARR